jgi:hypothetical protein
MLPAGLPHLPQNALFAPSGEPQVPQKLAIDEFKVIRVGG